MNYSNEVVELAYSELDKRRETASALHKARIDEIRVKRPDIFGVYGDIISTKDRLSDVILSGRANFKEEIEKIRSENLSNQKKLRRLLKSASLPEDYLEIPYTCPLCRDSGVYNGNRCECVSALLDKFAIKKLNEQCKIKLASFAEFDLGFYPEKYEHRSVTLNAREKMEENLRYCIEYAKNFSENSPSLFFYGGVGTGKTFLSGCIARELLGKGVNVAFDSLQNYLRDIENEYFGRAEGATLETLLGADLVILDDLGSEFKSNFYSSVIYNIINSRLNEGKPTIVSSNLSFEDFSKSYDPRIISRVNGMFKTIRFIGDDIRQIKRRKGIE